MSSNIEALVARQSAEDLVVRMFVATDERDWATLMACFSDPFVLDMTSMVGGEPATMAPREVAQAWAEGFKPLTHVHHQVGNFRTEVGGEAATVRCYGIALHHRSGLSTLPDTRRFVGTYVLQLASTGGHWRITRLQFDLKFIDGRLDLEQAT